MGIAHALPLRSDFDAQRAVGFNHRRRATAQGREVGGGEHDQGQALAVHFVGDDGGQEKKVIDAAGYERGRRDAGAYGFEQDGGGGAGAARTGNGENTTGGTLARQRMTPVDDFAGALVVAAPEAQ